MTTSVPTTTQLVLRSTLATIQNIDIDARIEQLARAIAVAVAFTYAAGHVTGELVHHLNATLAAFARELQEPEWHQHRLTQLRSRLAQRIADTPAPQPAPQPKPRRTAPKRTAKPSTKPAATTAAGAGAADASTAATAQPKPKAKPKTTAKTKPAGFKS